LLFKGRGPTAYSLSLFPLLAFPDVTALKDSGRLRRRYIFFTGAPAPTPARLNELIELIGGGRYRNSVILGPTGVGVPAGPRAAGLGRSLKTHVAMLHRARAREGLAF
jgi:hypothetical protein